MKIGTPDFDAEIDRIEGKMAKAGPDTAQLTLSTCLGAEKSCGWTGWLLEAAFDSRRKSALFPTEGSPVPAITSQTCPNCQSQVFRTGVARRFSLNPN
ncbi:MAG: hypothetical protein JXQ91_02155 [Vannielia sp.]|uniref:hypothetical protein n=1 Tax=Vannielia sp. TaxID=2813045 RepID=UPI003B8B8F9D